MKRERLPIPVYGQAIVPANEGKENYLGVILGAAVANV
jgi:hypothetical protein